MYPPTSCLWVEEEQQKKSGLGSKFTAGRGASCPLQGSCSGQGD